MSLFVELTRRALAHPHAASFVKRAVSIQSEDGDKVEIPTWGFVLIFSTAVFAMVSMSLVSRPPFAVEIWSQR